MKCISNHVKKKDGQIKYYLFLGLTCDQNVNVRHSMRWAKTVTATDVVHSYVVWLQEM
jgi:hypothetical protein